MLPKNSKPQ
jgi:hypothetical protein